MRDKLMGNYSVEPTKFSADVLFVTDQVGVTQAGGHAVLAAGSSIEQLVHDAGLTDLTAPTSDAVSSGINVDELLVSAHYHTGEVSYTVSDDHLLGDQFYNLFDNLNVDSSSFPVDLGSNSPIYVPLGSNNSFSQALPDIFSESHGGLTTHGGGGHGHGGGGSSSPSPSPTSLIINVTYDSSVGHAPSEFTTVVNDVVQFFESHFSDPVDVNIDVGYGEVDGQNLGPSALGESMTYLLPESYSTIVNTLNSDATTNIDQSAVASLPSTDPAGNFYVSAAEAKALGLLSATATGVDGYAGFSNQPGIFDYNNSDGVGSGTYDLFGVVAHEFSEIMGRILMAAGTASSSYNMLYDLFHYSSSGVMDYSASTPGYFSVDGGTTPLNTFNTNPGGDAGDWAGATVDAFNAFATSSVVLPVSNVDLAALDAIGWNSTNITTITNSSSSLTLAEEENQHPVA